MINGETHYSKVSRFVDEIPEELIQMEKLEPRVGRRVSSDEFNDDTLPWNKNQSRLGVSKFGMKSNSYASQTASYVSGTGNGAYSSFGGAAGRDLSGIFRPETGEELISRTECKAIQSGIRQGLYRAETGIPGLRRGRSGTSHQIWRGNCAQCEGRRKGF